MDKQIIIDDYFRKIVDINGEIVDYEIKNSEVLKLVQKIEKYNSYIELKEQECEELRNKLNSNIERMNEQNEKLHNENKELKSYIKEDLVPHTQIYIGLINRIKQQMKTILMVKTNGKYRPVKNSTKEQCYQVLGNIQELLGTNIIRLSEVTNGTNP